WRPTDSLISFCGVCSVVATPSIAMSHGGLEPSTRTPSGLALPSLRGSGRSDASSPAVSDASPAGASERSDLSLLSLLSDPAGRLTRCGRSGAGAGRDDCAGGGDGGGGA